MPVAGQVIIVSKDRDFAETLGEQIRGELELNCLTNIDKINIKQHIDSTVAIISPEPMEESLPCPVIMVKNPPVRLQELLDEVARLLHNQGPEDIKLGNGYSLEWRQKELSHASGKSVGLTDKEAQLLQCLFEGKGEAVAKEQLLKTVWGFDEALDTHTLETHIYRLRGKFRELADDDTMIAAIEGGYKLEL